MEKKPILKLRTYRGKDLNYDALGNIKNENNLVSLTHNSRNWVLFMKNLPLNGFCKVTVESGWSERKEGGYDEITDLKAYDDEVQEAFNGSEESKLTPEQKKIAELEAKLEKFMNANSVEKKTKTKDVKKEAVVEKALKEVANPEDIEVLREEYRELNGGKKAFHGWKADKLKEKIEDLKK
jgi:hypothetical protein